MQRWRAEISGLQENEKNHQEHDRSHIFFTQDLQVPHDLLLKQPIQAAREFNSQQTMDNNRKDSRVQGPNIKKRQD